MYNILLFFFCGM